jgi:NADH-quinone oxidoreductase subunit L
MILLMPIVIPLAAICLIAVLRKQSGRILNVISLAAVSALLVIAVKLFKQQLTYSLGSAGFGMDFNLCLYHFSGFILLAVAAFSFLIMLFCFSFMQGKNRQAQFYSYMLLTIAMVNGAVLADNLMLMLFFWEALLLPIFGLIAIGGKDAFKTAMKAVIIMGIADLCLMTGIGIIEHASETLVISKISMPLNAIGCTAFILVMIGAIAKIGSIPFHSWMPDASIDAPTAFMAFFPTSLAQLLGFYLLTRLSLDMYKLTADSWLSTLLMILGVITILPAVMMALIQQDCKKMLAYSSVSQVGYVMLGIGTCLPIGIIGGLFQMINHALYKSCLFLSAGSIEKQTSTTDITKLGGLWSKMPLTFICFAISGLAMCGVPPFNGFYSNQMIYAGLLQRGTLFYLTAILGTFFMAATILKFGHAIFFGKRSKSNENVREASMSMLIPMIIIAAICIFFGIYKNYALNTFISPVLAEQVQENTAHSSMLNIVTGLILGAALLHHLIASNLIGAGSKASEHIRNAYILKGIYDGAEKKYFDPYNIALNIIIAVSKILWRIDRAIDSIYNVIIPKTFFAASGLLKKLNTGNYSHFIIWSLVGGIVILVVMLKGIS